MNLVMKKIYISFTIFEKLWKTTLSLLKGNLKFRIGFLLLLIPIFIMCVDPIIMYLKFDMQSPTFVYFEKWAPPSLEHPLGTDKYGRDLFGLLIYSTKYTIFIGLLAGLISTLIGVSIGLFAGFKGGIVDTVLRSITDGMLVLPMWPVLIVFYAYLRSLGILTIPLILAAFSWPYAARCIRAQVLSLKEMPFVELAKITNLNSLEIVFKEIMPSLLPYIGVGLANSMVGAMIAEAGLEMLGFAPMGVCTLGMLINMAITWGALSMGAYNWLIPPIALLVIIFVALNLINIGLDEYYNPRLKRITGA